MAKRYRIYNDDVMRWAEKYKGEKFHALLTDAPYHLTTITKRFGKNGSAPAKFGKDGAFQRVGKGFMGQEWDGNMISFQPETWAALGEHLYPGAFGITFGGSRTAHRIAVAIEDAGFIIHPMIGWVYGSGFPKATRIDRQIDYHDGSQNWKGHRYGLQALKPALEPIIIFQKPYDGRPIDNIVVNGAGALNIDAGRIVRQPNDRFEYGVDGDENQTTGQSGIYGTFKEVSPYNPDPAGRWPANFILDASMANILDAQSGIQKGGFVRNKTAGARPFNNNGKDTGYHTDEVIDELDGGASRYFFQVQTQIELADPFKYSKKASTKERNAGLDDAKDIVYAQSGGAQSKKKQGKDEYLQDSIGLNRINVRKNDHPTVKPIDLNKYLASLLLPPVDYAPRRLLVPFSGVASEMIGALLAGWEYVEGVEIGKHYCELGEKRIRYWLKQK